MSVAKVIEIISSSTVSFDDAVTQGIAKASETITGIAGAWVQDQSVEIAKIQCQVFRRIHGQVFIQILFGQIVIDHVLRRGKGCRIAGSKGALKIQTLNSGVPGFNSNQMEQDDLVMSCSSRIGAISASRNPSCTCRIYLPPFDKWENRSGTHFGYRIDTKTTITETSKRFLFSKSVKKQEEYWPGYFIEFHSSHDPRFKQDEAQLLIRGDNLGHEVKSIKLTPGWWTLGMSVTSDGRVHYYGKQGVNDLTAADHLYSSFPYNYKAEYFATHFFNSCNQNDGRTWSTPIIIDDPAVYSMR